MGADTGSCWAWVWRAEAAPGRERLLEGALAPAAGRAGSKMGPGASSLLWVPTWEAGKPGGGPAGHKLGGPDSLGRRRKD